MEIYTQKKRNMKWKVRLQRFPWLGFRQVGIAFLGPHDKANCVLLEYKRATFSFGRYYIVTPIIIGLGFRGIEVVQDFLHPW